MDRPSKPTRTRTLGLAAAVTWTLAILALCSIPARDLPDVRILSVDKIGHFVMFAGFAWIWMRALSNRVRGRILWIVVGGLIYAAATEIYQGLVPFGREADAWDALANAAGLLAGISVWRVQSRRTRPHPSNG